MHLKILLFIILINTQSEKIFFGKQQICSSTNLINKEWFLKLKKDKTFEYAISEFKTMNYKLGIKDDTLKFTGFWQFYKDTLFLHSPDLTRYCKKDVKYKKKGESLYSLGARIDSIETYQVVSLYPLIRKKGNNVSD